ELIHSTEQMQALFLEVEQKENFTAALPLLQETYRLAHSIKGASRVVGLFPIEEMAHALEDRLQEILRNSRTPIAQATSLFLHLVDGFNAAFQLFVNGEIYDPAPLMGQLLTPTDLPVVAEVVESKPEPKAAVVAAAAQEPTFKREEQVMIASRQIDDLFRRVEEA